MIYLINYFELSESDYDYCMKKLGITRRKRNRQKEKCIIVHNRVAYKCLIKYFTDSNMSYFRFIY